MIFAVLLTPAAERQLRRLDPPARRRVQAAIELLASNPHPPSATILVGGGGELRVRTGDYRVIYEVINSEPIVLVIAVGHRREIYRD